MFNKTTIETALFGLVGLKQPYNPDYAILDSDNITSRSGYFATENSLVKIESIFDNSDYIEMSNVQKNDLLKTIQKASITKICNEIFNKISFVNRQFLYVNTLNLIEKEILPVGFVGYKIKKTCKNNYASINISRVLCNFDGTGSVTLLLFESGKPTAIKTKTITITNKSQVVDLQWEINSFDFGQDYYVGYLTTGLTVTPFARTYENAGIITYFTNFEVSRIKVDTHNNNNIFDLKNVSTSSLSYGLNFDITECYDYTSLIVNSQHLFAKAINLQFTISLIEASLASIRNNRIQRATNETISMYLIELEGLNRPEESFKKVGLKYLLLSEIRGIIKEIENLQKDLFSGNMTVVTMC